MPDRGDGALMKLLVFSDSHGNVEHMRKAVEQERPDQILHLGDVMRDAVELSMAYRNIPLELVPGNCDYATDVPAQKILFFEGRRILMTHGHTYHVKLGMGLAVKAAREAQVDILLFGHTHEAFCQQQDGLWIMNPGTIRGGLVPTCGVIRLEGERTICEILEIQRG